MRHGSCQEAVKLMMLDLADANKKIAHARKRCRELLDVFAEWQAWPGMVVLSVRDDELAKHTWFVSMIKEPAEDLSLLAGEVFAELRSALDYVAWQIYLAGGGGRDEKRARGIYFPIATDEQDFRKQLKSKVPTGWDDAVSLLLACQPFKQTGGLENALPALHAINNPSKHRELSLVAVGNLSLPAVAPDLGDDLGMGIFMPRPGPVLRLGAAEVLGKVSIFRGPPLQGMPETLRWSSGVKLQEPGDPQIELLFRDREGNEVGVLAMWSLIDVVESIVGSFSTLELPTLKP